LLERLGRTDESRRAIARAIRLSPRLERWSNQPLPSLQRLRVQPEPTELRFPQQTSIWSPSRLSRRALGQDLTARLEAVQNQMESQLYGDAHRELQDIVAMFPRSPEARSLLGQGYERQRQYENAIREYRQSIEIKPSAETYVLLARLYRTMNQTE